MNTELKYKEYIVTDRCDGILVGLLLYATKRGQDILCHTSCSEVLHEKITKYLLLFCKINSELQSIKIRCESCSEKLSSKRHIGTGISCGVDSLSTIIYYYTNGYKK